MIEYEIEMVQNDVPSLMTRAHYGVNLFADMFAQHVAAELAIYAPRKSGELQGSFGVQDITDMHKDITSSAEHAEWRAYGIGLWGSGNVLTPTTARALKFHWDKAGGMTVWKGDLPDEKSESAFRKWALRRGMIPFVKWPRGYEGFDYPELAARSSENRQQQIADLAMRRMGVY